MAYEISDGKIRKVVTIERDGMAHSVQSQPSEGREMAAIEAVRNAGGPRQMGWGYLWLHIPEIKLLEINRQFPELRAMNGRDRRAFWIKWGNSIEGAPYRLANRRGKGAIKR